MLSQRVSGRAKGGNLANFVGRRRLDYAIVIQCAFKKMLPPQCYRLSTNRWEEPAVPPIFVRAHFFETGEFVPKPAILALQDGTIFRGYAIGADGLGLISYYDITKRVLKVAHLGVGVP